MKKKVCVITAGHLSTCPRMVKVADTLAAEGYTVRVVSTRTMTWATDADKAIYSRRAHLWSWTPVDFRRAVAPLRYATASARFRLAQRAADHLRHHTPFWMAAAAQSRTYLPLVRAAVAEEADLYYGGGSALAATAQAADKRGKPFALDLEDYHTAEQSPGPGAARAHEVMHIIQARVLSRAAFLSAGSEDISLEYERQYGVRPLTINNTFPLPEASPDFKDSELLRLYWFSQTIGPGRGLEDAVAAMGIADIPGVLTLRGQAVADYTDRLCREARSVAPKLRVVVEEPASPDRMIDLARKHDVGLALEQPEVLNRDICLTNKAFTYLSAGLAVVLTRTRGQQRLADSLGSAAVLYRPGDIEALAAALRTWAADPAALRRAKLAAWSAAETRWRWDHPLEAGRVVAAVERVFNDR